jgi:hypothetical protein
MRLRVANGSLTRFIWFPFMYLSAKSKHMTRSSNSAANDHPTTPPPEAGSQSVFAGLAWRLAFVEDRPPADRGPYLADVRACAERMRRFATLKVGGQHVVSDPAMRAAMLAEAELTIEQVDMVGWMLGKGV